MRRLLLLSFFSLVLCGCSGLFISQRYKPLVESNWNNLKNKPYAYSLNVDSLLVEIRNIPIRDLGLIGPILIPFIPITINKYNNSIFFDLHLSTNDTNFINPPLVHLFNPITKESFQPIKILPLNFDLVKRLKLYHREFEYTSKYRINRTYFYQFDLKDKVPLMYIKIDSIGRTNENQVLIKYELKRYVKYKPIIVPWPS